MSFRPPAPRITWRIASALAALAPVAAGLRAATPAAAPAAVPAAPSLDKTGPMSAPEAAGLLHLASDLEHKGDYSTAEIAYRQVLQRRDFSVTDQKTALLGFAHMFREAGALTKAAAIYEKFLKEFPDDPRVPSAFLDLGRTLREMGAYNLALTRFYSVINTTLKLSSQSSDDYALLAKTAQFEIAQTYYESGDYAEAGKFFERVRLLELSPQDRARAHFMAGCAEASAGELDQAVLTLRTFLDQWPQDANAPEARYVLAMTLDKLKRPQEALVVTLDLLKAEHGKGAADPKLWNYWQRRTGNQLANSFFQQGDIVNALMIYNGLVGLSSEPSWRLPLTYQVALCYERLFQLDQARAAYQKVVDDAAAKPGEAAPTSEMAELAKMASWRLGQLQWHDEFNKRLGAVLTPTDGAAPTPPAAKPEASTSSTTTDIPPRTS